MNATHRQTKDKPAKSPQAKANMPPRQFAVEAARLLADYHCEEVIVFDVSRLSEVTYYVIIGSGTSDQQIKGVAVRVNELAKECGFERYASEHNQASTWLVADFVEVMVHLFEPVTRGHYDLEMLWGDAPRVHWARDHDDSLGGS